MFLCEILEMGKIIVKNVKIENGGKGGNMSLFHIDKILSPVKMSEIKCL